MRILQLANFYGPTSGGLRTCVDELGARYAAAGHDVMLVVPGRHDDDRRERGRRIVTLDSPKIPGLGGYRAVIDAGAVRRLVSRFDPDVIELSDRTTLARHVLAGRTRGNGHRRAPVVLVAHERLDVVVGDGARSFGARPRTVTRAVDRWTRWVVARTDAAVCASRYAAEELHRHRAVAGGTATSRPEIVRIPLGVDLEVFRPDAASGADRGTSSSQRPATLLHVGRLSPEKQPHRAIDTIRRLRDRGLPVRLVVAGTGPLELHLRRAAMGLPVEFLGHVAGRAELARHMAASDVVLATGPFETFGLAALEALACGTPIVVPPSGSLREIVSLGTGIVAGEHADGFADAVAALLVGDRDAQRRACRARAEEFGWDRTATSFLDLHTRLAGREHRSTVIGAPPG